jgi:FAD/FMN-containing dehydrogenase
VRAKLGEDSITTDDDELQRHGYSEWSTINIDVLPIAVVYPKSTAEVSEIAKVCYEHKIPIGKEGFTLLLGNCTYHIHSTLLRRFKSGGQFLGSVRWILYRLCLYG